MSAEEYDPSLADGDSKISQLLIAVGGVVDLLQLEGGILSADDGCHVDVLEMVNGGAFLEGVASKLAGWRHGAHGGWLMGVRSLKRIVGSRGKQ